MDSDQISIHAVGDVAPAWIELEPLFELAAPTLKQADIVFGQLEEPVCEEHELQRYNYYPRRLSPNKVSVLTDAGFHVMSFANNHSLDSGEQGLFETLDTVTNSNIAIVGAGRNIDEARKPSILTRKKTKVAFLAYCSVLPPGYEATADRCGCAPMRASTFYEQVDWQAGTTPRIITLANKDDLAAMVADIKKVRALADVVIMSIHWGIHIHPAIIAMYQKEVGYAAIDAGVDLILGHHAHILKGIDMYKGKAIFYSLGNFVMPSRKGLLDEGKKRDGVKTDPEYPHYGYPADSRKTIIAKCIISNKKIERVSFLPVLINKQAQPQVMQRKDNGFNEVLCYMTEITDKPYQMPYVGNPQGLDAEFEVDGDEVVVHSRRST